jgi:hypothetical protein
MFLKTKFPKTKFPKTKIALSALIVLGTALTASAATNLRVRQDHGAAVTSVIPGYDKDGRTVGIPDPDKFTVPSKRS